MTLNIAAAGRTYAQNASVVPAAPAIGHPPAVPGPPPTETVPNQTKHPVVYLWPNGAPGSESKQGDPEKYRLAGSSVEGNDDILIISSVHRPSITVYLPPKQMNTRAAFVVAPGGGFSELYITPEGYRIAEWLSQHGIAAFVLKYRLPNEQGSEYKIEDAVADMQRAIRTVKSHAVEWGLDPDRVGVIGFSAGGFLAGLAGSRSDVAVAQPSDDIDRISARPAFEGLIYGAPYRPAAGNLGPLNALSEVARDTPPTFLAAGANDPISQNYPDVYKMFKAAGVPVELHLYAGGRSWVRHSGEHADERFFLVGAPERVAYGVGFPHAGQLDSVFGHSLAAPSSSAAIVHGSLHTKFVASSEFPAPT